jgi:hypothetical protein
MRRLAVVLVLLAAAAAPPALAAAGYEEAFRDGMSALDQKKWAVADASFRTAVAANPREGGKQIRVYGTWLLDYLPHYYLGVALYQLGDVEGAAQEWRESRRQGAILSTPLRADLERWEKRLPPEKAAPPATAEASAKPASQNAGKQAPAATGRTLPKPTTHAQQPSQGAGAAVEPPSHGSAAQLPAHLAETGEGGAPAHAAAEPATTTEREASEPAQAAPAPATPTRTAPAPASSAPAAATQAPQRVDAAQLLLPPARLYFGGRYREALASLRELRWPQSAPARACLLEAAAAYALYRQGGSDDSRYLDQARAALHPCPQLNYRDRPDPRLFSPAFTRWFDDNVPRP